MRPIRSLAAAFALLAVSSAALAATPEQAAKARACGVQEAAVAASQKTEPQMRAFLASFGAPSRGAGQTEIVVLSDYSCPSCKALSPTFAALARENPKMRFAHVEFPVFGRTMISSVTGNKTLEASFVGLALAESSAAAYFAYHDTLMAARGGVSQAQIDAGLKAAGANAAAVRARAASPAIKAKAEKALAFAKAVGVAGTPGVIANGVVLPPGSWDVRTLACLAG